MKIHNAPCRVQKLATFASLVALTIALSACGGSGGFGGGSYSDVKTLPVFAEMLPQAQRRPREQLIAVANSYFEGLEQATGKVTPFEPSCQRRENGSITANNPDAKNAMSKLSCGAQFDTGFSPFITEVRGRRFPLVDEERGQVLAFLSFDHSGRIAFAVGKEFDRQ